MGKQTIPRRRTGDVTFEEFRAQVREDQKADLLNGVIYLASPENTDANDLHGWLVAVMRPFVRKRKLGKIFSSRVALRLDEQNGPEPDVLFIRTSRLHLVHRGHIAGPADLALEIVSPESVERDSDTKRMLYEKHGVGEYWIIDEHEQTVLPYRLGSSGKYRQVKPRNGELHSEVIEGFWLRVEWLWEHPLPDELDTVQAILARTESE